MKTFMLFMVSAFIFSTTVFASENCVIASELKGVATNGVDSFYEDGFSGKEFEIHINGDKSKIIGMGVDDFIFEEITPNLIVGKYTVDKDASVILTVGIDRKDKEVLFTRTRIGFLLPDSASIFSGRLSYNCKQ